MSKFSPLHEALRKGIFEKFIGDTGGRYIKSVLF